MKGKLKPFMQRKEIKIIEKQLFGLGKQNGKVDILEWGSGGSTVYFSKFLKDNNIQYTWLSIEYNKKWYDKISEMVEKDLNTKVVLFDSGNNNLRQRNIDMNEYVDYPKTLNKQFDFILVDGRKRRRCLIEAQKLLSPKGVVFLHDAQRKYYHCVLKNYSDSVFIGPYLWRGRNKPILFFCRVFHELIYLFWQPIIWVRFWMITILRKVYYRFSFLQKIRKSYQNENI